jgi:hypothetical protein
MPWVVAAAVLLSSAGGAAQQQASPSLKEQRTFARVKGYCAALFANRALDPIRSKVSLTIDVPATREMWANEHHVTAEERPVIREWANRVIKCNAVYTKAREQYLDPIQAALAQSFFDTTSALRAQLHNGQLSYGGYNRERQRLRAEYDSTQGRLRIELGRQDAEAQSRARQISEQEHQKLLSLQQAMAQQQQAYRQQWEQQHGTATCVQIGSLAYCDY